MMHFEALSCIGGTAQCSNFKREKNSQYLVALLAEPVSHDRRKKAKRCGKCEHVVHGRNNRMSAIGAGTISEIQENMFSMTWKMFGVASHEDEKVLEKSGLQGLVKHAFSWGRHWTFA